MLIYDEFGVPSVIGSTLFIFYFLLLLTRLLVFFIRMPYVESFCEGRNYFLIAP